MNKTNEVDTVHLNIDQSNALSPHDGEPIASHRRISALVTSSDASFESILCQCGDFGRFQWIHFFFINLMAMCAGIVSFYYVFAAAEPEHRCRWPNETSFRTIDGLHDSYMNERWERCLQKLNGTVTECTHGWIYDRSIFGYTFTEEANLVCAQKAKKSWLATSMQSAGFSLIIIGSLSDRYGRKRLTSIVSILLFSTCFLTQILMQFGSLTMNTKFILLVINQFASGLAMSTFSLAFILMLELTSSRYTNLTANLAFIAYTLGEIWIALVAYLTQDWQKLKWMNTGFIGLGIPYLYFMPESPLYLYSQRQYRKLETLLRRIATTNGRKELDWYPAYEQLIRRPSQREEQSQPRYSGRIRIKLFVVTLLGLTSLMLYYKISYGLTEMKISPYLSILIGAVLESIAYLTTSLLISSKLGRKGSLMIMMSLTIVSLLCLPLLNEHHPLGTIICAQFGKYASSGTVAITWIFVPELFPTSIRSSANGLFIASSRIGAIIAPVIDVLFAENQVIYTHYLIAVVGVIVVLLCLILPETKDATLAN